MQVQQVFIRQAYKVLTNHVFLKKYPDFATQLIISTHSSHIARESDFADLRYFKRLPEKADCNIATSKVINLSDVFGKEDKTSKFVTRYLQEQRDHRKFCVNKSNIGISERFYTRSSAVSKQLIAICFLLMPLFW